jgi:hypothetical protein
MCRHGENIAAEACSAMGYGAGGVASVVSSYGAENDITL